MPPIHGSSGKPRKTRKDQTTSASAPTTFDSPIHLAAALHLSPDPIQSDLLADPSLRIIINCARQWGKSTITAVRAIYQAISQPLSLTLVLSPSARQSGEFLNKVRGFLPSLGIPIRGDGTNEISALFPNRSRIVGLPGNEDTIRGFSGVSLLIIDEAARVEDSLYHSILPAIATSPNAQVWVLSTPKGRQGFFFDIFHAADPPTGPNWKRVSVPAGACPRIQKSFLDEQQATMPHHQFRQEYCCEFLDADTAVLSSDLLDGALLDLPPLDLGVLSLLPFTAWDATRYHGNPHFFLGLDLGQAADYTALCILERADVLLTDRPDPLYFPPQTEKRYAIRHIERLPLRKTYPSIARHVAGITRHPSLTGTRTLAIDATGIGAPFVDMLREEHLSAYVDPVMITSGDHGSYDKHAHRVPRNELLTSLLLALQKGILKISKELPLAGLLLQEMASLRYKEGRIETAKSTQHDDLVFAAALATWRATLKV